MARVIGTEDNPWGVLKFLVGTVWEPLFPRVTQDVLDQALRGYATPLMRVLGPPPQALAKRLPVQHTVCYQRTACINYGVLCVPGPKVPDCWETSEFSGTDISTLNYVVRLWRDDVVIVVLILG